MGADHRPKIITIEEVRRRALDRRVMEAVDLLLDATEEEPDDPEDRIDARGFIQPRLRPYLLELRRRYEAGEDLSRPPKAVEVDHGSRP